MNIFSDISDRKIYLTLLQQARDQSGCTFLSWCLMDNHVHFIIVPPRPESLAELFHWAHGHYTRHFNKHSGSTGHLWQERFSSVPLGPNHLANALRYILLNPVKAGMIAKSTDYPWSSAAYTFGLKHSDPLISDPIDPTLVTRLKKLGNQGVEKDQKEIEDCMRGNFAYASEETIQMWEEQHNAQFKKHKRGPAQEAR